MKIAYIKDHLGHTGGTYYLYRLLRQLDRTQIEPLVFSLRGYHEVAEKFEEIDIAPRFFNRSKWDFRAASDILEILRTQEIDLLHIEGAKTFLCARWAANLCSVPALLHFHNMLPMPWPIGQLQRRLLRKNHYGIAVSHAVCRWASQEFSFSGNQIETLYNFVDGPQHKSILTAQVQELRDRYALAKDTVVLGHIARVDSRIKGQTFLLQVFKDVLQVCPKTHLLIVGDGPDLKRCQELTHELQIAQAVTFTGHVDDVEPLQAVIDIAIAPSLVSEGLSLSILEAAVHSIPAIVFDAGGLSEAIIDGKTGILIKQHSKIELKNAITELAMNQDKRIAMGEAARQYARQFSSQEHLQRMMEIYSMLTKNNPQTI